MGKMEIVLTHPSGKKFRILKSEIRSDSMIRFTFEKTEAVSYTRIWVGKDFIDCLETREEILDLCQK